MYAETVTISKRPPKTLGALKKKLGKTPPFRSVRDELRGNLIRELREGKTLFRGIHGYEDSVIPELVNALLSKHSLILLGLRGQAKSRILRGIVELLDQEIPAIEGCEIRDDPFYPICGVCRRRASEAGDDLPIRFVSREERFVEKLATPDVTIADIIGDLDPIKASRGGKNLADHENIHFGLLPRTHRGIFAMNELPDLAPKIQVGLFNIMQEGDVQIKGFPIRLPLDVLLVFSANPEDYTARGKIVTPLKDRIGSEIRTHYPLQVEQGVRICRAWSLRRVLRSFLSDQPTTLEQETCPTRHVRGLSDPVRTFSVGPRVPGSSILPGRLWRGFAFEGRRRSDKRVGLLSRESRT